MIDLSLLRIVKHKDEFFKLWRRIPMNALEKNTQALLKDFATYFDRFPTHEKIDIPTFVPLFNAQHPKLDDDQRAAFTHIINKVREDVPQEERDGIMASVMELRLGNDLADLLLKFEAGDVPNIHAAIEDISVKFRRDAQIKGLDFLRDPIGDLLEAEASQEGLQWRLSCLNEATRGLMRGEFGIIAGRPDKGKTTLVVSEVAHMAKQLPVGKTVVWLNNEGPGRKIVSRFYQAALGLKMSEMIDLHRTGHLEDMYRDFMGEDWKVRVFDIHGMDTYSVERIIEQNNAGLVVYDMIDNVRGFGDAARTDLALEQMYQWARELCVKYDCIGIATSQISNEGDGLQFPTLGMLKDSKTGKQGACDFQLMVGASNDIGLSKVRYISMPKNKLRREGYDGDPRATVRFVPEIARYEDIVCDTEDGE